MLILESNFYRTYTIELLPVAGVVFDYSCDLDYVTALFWEDCVGFSKCSLGSS
jgi:hypothetical protein